MGCRWNGTAPFVWDSLEWLCRRTDTLDVSFNGGYWRISSESWDGHATTLPLALAAAVQSFDAARCAEPEDAGGDA